MTESRQQLSRFMAIFAGGTMISRVLGLVRTMVISSLIPVPMQDAFWAAFRLPNMLRDIVGEGASNAAFIPVLSETLEHRGEKAFRELASALMSAMILVLGIVTVIGVLFAPQLFQFSEYLQKFTGASQKEQSIDLVVSLTRWTFPYILFIGLTVFQMGPLFVMRHYSTPSWSPALLNVFMILSCLGPFRNCFPNPAYALVAGVWLGGIAQFGVQYYALGKRTQIWFPNFRLGHPGIRQAFWLWMPVVAGQATGEVNKLIDMLFAYQLGQGTISSFMYANQIVQVPLSMFGVAISAAILPVITRAAARNEKDEVRTTIMHGLRQSYFLTCPAMLALIVLGEPIVAAIYQRGHFDAGMTHMASVILAYFAVGLLCFAWVKVTVTGFYAFKDTVTPVIVASISMGLNIAMIFLFVRRMGYQGLALATTISYSVNFILLYILLCRRIGKLWDRAFVSSMVRITFAGIVMVLVLHFMYNGCCALIAPVTTPTRVIDVALSSTVAGLVYWGVGWLLRLPDVGLFMSLVRRVR